MRLSRLEQMLDSGRLVAHPDEAQPLQQKAVPCNYAGIDARLARLERNVMELSTLIRSGPATTITGQHGVNRRTSLENVETPATSSISSGVESTPSHDKHTAKRATRPVLLLRDLQTRFFGPKKDFSDEVLTLGSVVSAGIISMGTAQRLMRMCVWFSIKSSFTLNMILNARQL